MNSSVIVHNSPRSKQFSTFFAFETSFAQMNFAMQLQPLENNFVVNVALVVPSAIDCIHREASWIVVRQPQVDSVDFAFCSRFRSFFDFSADFNLFNLHLDLWFDVHLLLPIRADEKFHKFLLDSFRVNLMLVLLVKFYEAILADLPALEFT